MPTWASPARQNLAAVKTDGAAPGQVPRKSPSGAPKPPSGITVLTTCPQSKDFAPEAYVRCVQEIACWSEDAGYQGALIYTDNALVDPWLVAEAVIRSTTRFCPLVAVQPAYMHPYAVAKMVASLAFLYGRRIYLNMVAGGFRRDLIALGDPASHDERYSRLIEYTLIVKALLEGRAPIDFEGKYYSVAALKMTPPIAPDLVPRVFVSGSSPAGLAAARALGAVAVKYPEPPAEENEQEGGGVESGIRLGVIARDTDAEAWRVAHQRFPEDRKGQLTHGLAMTVSDSQWHRQLSKLGEKPVSDENPYWLGPFQNYKTFCPYLVGSYERVGSELGRYIAKGFGSFILDVPASPEELEHTAVAFEAATTARQ